MRRILALALLVGCSSDYDIGGDVEVFGEYNPQPIEVPLNTDRIVQTTAAEVDVLFVIDNSGSMSDNQQKLADNFPEFMKEFDGSGLDYHIGIISTDMDFPAQPGSMGVLREVSPGTGQRWIDETFADPVDVFAQAALVGDQGSGDEKGIASAYTALELKKNEENAGFLRDEAGLHITVISDEDDSSRGNPITKVEFIDYLNSLRDDPELISFNSIVTISSLFPGLTSGQAYLDITNAVGGLKRDIAKDEWSDMLGELGLQAIGLKAEYFLSQLPVEGTIEVQVIEDGVTFVYDEGTEWSYNPERNSVTFLEFVPPELAEVLITYTLQSAQQVQEDL